MQMLPSFIQLRRPCKRHSESTLTAQGEIDVILDIVSGIEDGQHLAIGMVSPSQKSMQAQNRERMLALSAKQAALQAIHHLSA